jgi:hypothetical protein
VDDLIDLHMHTTASDGACTPAELVGRVVGAGIRTFAVADHDTVAAVPETVRLAADACRLCVPAIEITAVCEGKDVHVLGYFINPGHGPLQRFLAASRADRLRRARVMCDRLAELAAPIDFEGLLERAGGPNSGKAIARPVVARALVEAGHVKTVQEAFDRFLADGAPAYAPRIGASPAEVIGVIRDAGGIASLAHPGPLGKDHLIESLAADGLAAVECFHADHDEAATAKYLDLARRFGLGVSGGSDFHGPGTRRADQFGRISLPPEHYEDLIARASAGRTC